MPQTHNKLGGFDIGNKSKFLAAYNFSEQSLRRVRVKNGLDKRLCNVKLRFYEKEARINSRKIENVRTRMVDNLQKRLAYKLVLRKHPIANAPDYKKALDKKYTYEALYNEVKDMVVYMKPELARERQAKAQIDVNRNRYNNILRENRAALNVLCPPPSKFGQKVEEEVEEATPSPELPAIEKRTSKALATLRRRVISLDDSKPNSAAPSPIKSPTKMPPLSKPPSSNSMMGAKRQGISMSMMKKQTSFVSNKEKTEMKDADGVTTNLIDEAKVNVDTSRTVKTGRKSVVNSNGVVGDVEQHTPKQTDQALVSSRTDDDKLNKQSVLPPIRPQKQQSPGITANDMTRLNTGTPVKLPVLKMANNAGKEIRVH